MPTLPTTGASTFRGRLARNTLAAILTNGWSMVLSLVTLPILVRELGAAGFGVWALLQAFSATNGWLSITLTGLAVAAVRQVAGAAADEEDDRRIGSAVATSFLVLAVPGVVLGAVMAAVGGPLLDRAFDDLDIDAGTLRLATVALGATVALDHVFAAIGAVLEGLQRVAAARGLDAVRKTGVAVAVVVAAVVDGDIGAVAVAAAGATLAGVAVAAIVAAADRRVRPARPAPGEVRGVVRYAATLSTLTATGVLHRTMDRIIAGVMFGPTAVAVVEIANQVQGGATALLSATSYPVLSAAPWLHARDDPPATRSLLERVTRYSTVLTLPLVVVIVVTAGPLVRAWVGVDIGEEAVGLVQVAVLYVAVAAPLQAGSNLLQGIGRARAVLRASAVSVAVNLAVSLVLVETVGLVGLFWGTLAGAAVVAWALSRSIAAEPAVGTWRPITSAVVAAAPPAVAAGAASGAVLLVAGTSTGAGIVAFVAGLLAGVAAAFRWSLRTDERRELLGAVQA